MGQVLSAFGLFLSVVFKNLSNVFSIEEGQVKRALTGRGAPTPQKHQTFGLVIGIDKYKYIEPNQDLRGAVQDADDFESYLVNDRGVPKANINSLRNEKATRSAIINGFRELKDNSKIIPGEVAIIIYFAGHGTTARKPTTWTNWEAPEDIVEMLCPADINHDINGNKVEGIPDRTLSQLLMELSNAKGDNITLILDCCHAAGMNRGVNDPARRSRTLYFKNVQDLSPTCDEHIYSRESRTRSFQDRESGFSGSYLGSHILLAACRRTQTAWEEGHNGLFTTALLKSLRNAASSDLPPTYDSLMRGLLMPSTDQTPQWDGKHVHRFIFDSWQVPAGRSMIPCYREGPSDLVLHAGSFHGITEGSTFEIFSKSLLHPNVNDLLVTLTAIEVKQSISRLRLTSADFAVLSSAGPSWYARLRKASTGNDFPLHIYCNDPDTLDRILADSFESTLTAHVVRVENRDDAEILLTVKANMVHFSQGKRANAWIEFSSYFPPYSPCSVHAMPDIRDFINRYAHFTSRLIIKNPAAASNFVTIEMNKLRYDMTDRGLKVDKQVAEDGKPFEIVVKTRKEDRDPYGFTIHHNGGVDLYAYLLYFDASKLTIDAWYRPQMGQMNQGASVDPCLMKKSTLTLGYGRVGMDPMAFDVPAGQNADVCFVKIIVTTKAVEIGPIEQFESSPDVKSRGAFTWTPPPSDLKWASRIFTIVSKRSQSVVSQAKENALPKNEESDLV